MKDKIQNILNNRIALLLFGLLTILIFVLFGSNGDFESTPELSPYPDGKDFAFTITDDPDGARLEMVKPIYDLLSRIGLRTTAVVWVEDPVRSNGIPDKPEKIDEGDSCENVEYRKFVKNLQIKGFEIALHTVSAGNDLREKTMQGYEKFRSYFGSYPKINIMHSNNLENVYWGKKVVGNGLMKFLIGFSGKKAKFPYSGEIPQDKYFWADILKEKTKYVRMWGTSHVNTLKFNPSMPYHDQEKPYVNYWFSFSDGYDVEIFNELISDKNIKKLKNQRGSCFVYTHFSAHFTEKDDSGSYKLNQIFKTRMEKLSQDKQGWFAPASVILDRLLLMKNVNVFRFQNGIAVVNSNPEHVNAVTLLSSPKDILYDSKGRRLEANVQGEINIGEIEANEALTLFYEKNQTFTKNEIPGRWENMNLFFQRMLVFIKHRVVKY